MVPIRATTVTTATTPTSVVEATNDYFLVCVIKRTSGAVVISHNQSTTLNAGFDPPTDEPVYVLLTPGSKLFVSSPTAGEQISFIIQHAPFLGRM